MQFDLDTAKRFFRRSPFMRDLGIEPVAIGEGRITTGVAIAERFLQHTGQVHAGLMATLADHSMGAAAQTLAEEGRWAMTAELKTSQLRPAKGERLICEAHVLKPGRNVSFTEAEVYTETAGERTLVMKASATMAMTAIPAAHIAADI